ncbi:MAG: acyl-CoA dehydrogenase, partial [Chloroflexi bacterium]
SRPLVGLSRCCRCRQESIGNRRSGTSQEIATTAAVSGLVTCMQVMGARGFLIDSTLWRHLAAAKMAEYLDGTSEIQNVVVARSLLGGALD